MHRDRRRARRMLVLAGLLLGGSLAARPSAASDNPILDLFTTTTTTAPRPTTTATPTTSPSPTAPAGAADAGGDGVAPPSGGIVVPPEARRIIDAVKRTPPSDDQQLVDGIQELVALGATQDEAYRIGMGRFPVAGVARWRDDWLLPRYGPGFRFHLGCDVVAPYGTPVRAPVDGIVTSSKDALGGLTARVTMGDGTRFAFAHLSRLADGPDARAVTTGEVIGYVGDSGNAAGGTPHVHVAVYPKGKAPTDPKPILDGFLRDAQSALPGVVRAYAAAHPQVIVPLLPVPADAAVMRPALATRLMARWVSPRQEWSPLRLYALAADPGLGAGDLLRSELEALAASIDWLGQGTEPRGTTHSAG